MGDAAAFEEQFRGAPTIYAVFADLMNSMGLTSGARVLFGGCSAGARGAMVHLDNVALWFESYGISVRGMLDSGLWVDFNPLEDYANMGGTLTNQAKMIYDFANVSSVIPADCAAAYSATPWLCLFGQYRMPFLKTDYFLNEAQFDDFQTNFYCETSPIDDTLMMQGGFDTSNAAQTEGCFNNFQQAMVTVLDTLPTQSQSAGSSLFSSTCSSHCVTDGAEFWSITVQSNGKNASMASMMADWWFGNNEPRVISPCVGWQCMAVCVPEERKFPQGFGATETVASDGANLGGSDSDGQNDGANPVPPSEMTPTEASDVSTDTDASAVQQAPQQQQLQPKPQPQPTPAPARAPSSAPSSAPAAPTDASG